MSSVYMLYTLCRFFPFGTSSGIVSFSFQQLSFICNIQQSIFGICKIIMKLINTLT